MPRSRDAETDEAPAARSHPRRLFLYVLTGAVALVLAAVVAFAFVAPPTTLTMIGEGRRLGGVEREWVPMEAIAPVMARGVVAAEDANFCRHWGFDMAAIRLAIAEGGQRGASTLS